MWDHVRNGNEKFMSSEKFQMQREIFKMESDHLMSWEAHVRHYNLSKLRIDGFQVEEKLKRYIRQVLKAPVSLELVALRKSRISPKYWIRHSSMSYPPNEEKISSNARTRVFP